MWFKAKSLPDIAYVQNKILNTEAFYTLMATAFVLNILVPITITAWKPYYCRDIAQQPAEKDGKS